MQTVASPRLHVKTPTTEFLRSCLRYDGETDQLAAITSKIEHRVFVTQVKTRACRRLHHQGWHDIEDLLTVILKQQWAQVGYDTSDPVAHAKKAKYFNLFHGVQFAGVEFDGLDSEAPLADMDGDRLWTLFIDLDLAVVPEIEPLLNATFNISYHSSKSGIAGARLRCIIVLAESLSMEQASAVSDALNQLPGVLCRPNQLAYPPIRFWRGPPTTIFVHEGPLADWESLRRLLRIECPAQPRAQPTPASPRPYLRRASSTPTTGTSGFVYLANEFANPETRRRAWRHMLGSRIVRYPGKVRCPFDGHEHDDEGPSAALRYRPGMLPAFECYANVHGLGGQARAHNIGETYRLVHLGRFENVPARRLRKKPHLQHMWACRLLVDMGYISLDDFAAWPADFDVFLRWLLDHGAEETAQGLRIKGRSVGPGALRKAHEAVRLMTACKRAMFDNHHIVISDGFLGEWAGMAPRTAARVIAFLKVSGLFEFVEEWDHSVARFTVAGEREDHEASLERLSGKRPMKVWNVLPLR